MARPQRRLADEEIAEIVRNAQKGDPAAFALLHKQYNHIVFGLATRMVNDTDAANDVCQEVWVRVMEKIGQVRIPSAFPGWLRTTTKRTALNMITRGSPVVTMEPFVLSQYCKTESTPLKRALTRERKSEVHAGMSRLSPLDQATLRAHYMRHQPIRAMSETFDAPLGTIKRRLFVARQRLADELKPLNV